MTDREYWETIYRALIMIIKAIARYKLGRVVNVTAEDNPIPAYNETGGSIK